ncbi:MAG: glycoside hydrolase family 3 protein, partial [Clostridia bacterium]|nr:glycoside hydrolase family 3 protein [Clostridia bacterium]
MMEIRELINQMTLEEKVDYFCGSPDDYMSTAGCERLGIRPQRFTDGPLGVRSNENAVAFPSETSMAATWNKELVEEVGGALADECIHGNRDMLLGPGANIKRTPLCGRNFEYFSEDPCLSGKIAASYIRGVQKKNVGACVKHFVANNQETDRSFVSADIDERTLREVYLKSFEIAIKEGNPSAVMTAYNRINGLKCSESQFLLKKILRDEWGYEGIIMSDWLEVKKGATSLKSGLNLTMPFDMKIKNDVLEGVKSGKISETVLDTAIEKLIKFSQKDKPKKDNYDRAAQHKIAKKAAEEGIVLLKNDGVLPINPDKHKKIVIIGEYAKNPVYSGNGSARVFPGIENINSAVDSLERIFGGQIEINYIEGYLANRTEKDNIFAFSPVTDNEEGKMIAEADLVLMFLGNQFNVETEDADRAGATLDTYYYSYINRVLCFNKNIVLILQTGSAVVPHLWDKRAKAIIEMWYAGEAGCSAVAEVLAGRVNPSGKLPETFPKKLRTDIDYPGDGFKVSYNEK